MSMSRRRRADVDMVARNGRTNERTGLVHGRGVQETERKDRCEKERER